MFHDYSGTGDSLYGTVQDRHFLGQNSNGIGNIYDDLVFYDAGQGQNHYGIVHNRYFLSKHLSGIGNIYEGAGQNDSDQGNSCSDLSGILNKKDSIPLFSIYKDGILLFDS